jgi:endonuclease G
MQPQIHAFNEGVWGEMENQVRDLVENYKEYTWTGNVDTLYVCRGGTIGAPMGTISDPILETRPNGLIVPHYYFCALLKKKNSKYEAIGFIFEHKTNSDTSIAKYCVSIDELEARTGFDFFCNLPDDVEKNVETECNPASFGFK